MILNILEKYDKQEMCDGFSYSQSQQYTYKNQIELKIKNNEDHIKWLKLLKSTSLNLNSGIKIEQNKCFYKITLNVNTSDVNLLDSFKNIGGLLSNIQLKENQKEKINLKLLEL